MLRHPTGMFVGGKVHLQHQLREFKDCVIEWADVCEKIVHPICLCHRDTC